MNTTNKFIVLAAVAALMIGATIVVATTDQAYAQDRTRNNINRDSTSGQQNSGDTIANGGNFVGGDQTVSRGYP
jgi:spermidine/putrescine-binding protein